MYIVIFISILCVILTYLESNGVMSNGMRLGFILITILGAIHYDYGSDYMVYYDLYKNVTVHSYNLDTFLQDSLLMDPGWLLLCYLFKPLGGFFMLVAVLFVIQNTFVYRIIRKEVPRNWWPFAVIIYLFNSALFLLSFSMLRQSFVIFVFLGIWPLIKERRIFLSLFILIFCSLVHKSAIILLPFALIGVMPMKNTKIYTLFIISFFILLWFSKDIMNDILEYMLAFEQFSDYDVYTKSDENVSFGLGYLLGLIPLLISLMYLNNSNANYTQNDKRIVLISLISSIITPFSFVIPLIERVAMYFYAYEIIAMPKIYSSLKSRLVKQIFISIYLLLLLVDYYGFFTSPIYKPKYEYFHTIFSVIL